jgi:hypothetical protein
VLKKKLTAKRARIYAKFAKGFSILPLEIYMTFVSFVVKKKLTARHARDFYFAFRYLRAF